MPKHREDRCCSRVLNRLQYFWYVHAMQVLLYLASAMFLILSLAILFFEVSLYLDWDHASVYKDWTSYSQENSRQSFFVANLACIIPLAYICSCSYFGLFRIKVSSVYAIHANQKTDPPCLVYSGMLILRLAVAVAYHAS